MHISFVIKKTYDYMYRRKLNFFLTLVISVITVYLMTMVLNILANSYHKIIMTKKLVNDGNSLNISIVGDSVMKTDAIGLFYEELSSIYGDDFGMFANYEVSTDYSGETLNVLYIDESIMDLCELKVDSRIEKSEDADIYAYVGYNLKNEYPVGTIIENIHTGTRMQIVGILKKDSMWILELPFASDEDVDRLDNKIVSVTDTAYYDLSTAYYGNGSNSWYIKCDSKKRADEAKEKIEELSSKYCLMVYTNTIDDLVDDEKKENEDLFDALGILFVFVLIIAVLAYVTSNMADIYSRQYDFGIMYINGVSSVDIYMMIWLENFIKLALAFGISVCLYLTDISGSERYVFCHIIIPAFGAALILFSTVLSWLLYMTIKRKKVLSLIDCVRL